MSRDVIIVVDGDFTRYLSGSHNRFRDVIHFVISECGSAIVYSRANHPEAPWDRAARDRFAAQFPYATLVTDELGRGVQRATRAKNIALSLAPMHAKAILQWCERGGSPNWEGFAALPDDYVLLVSFLDQLTVVNGFPFRRVVVDTHDVKFIRYAKVRGRALHDLSSLARFRAELGALTCCSASIAISATEAGLFRAVAEDTRCFFIPLFPVALPRVVENPSRTFSYDLLFVGSCTRFNIEGLSHFLREHPWARELRLGVAGAVCASPELGAFAREWPNLRLLGFVDDLPTLYASSKAAISPVEGTGLKIKLVEALGQGKPVFASRHSREALPPGYDHCVFPIEQTRIAALLNDDARLAASERAALSYFRQLGDTADQQDFAAFLQAERG